MAKQNVGFGERHLEKFVVGVAGAVLAAMAFLFVLQDPYSVEVSGETLGPTSFYPRLDEQATQKLASLKNASGEGDSTDPPWKPPQQKSGSSTELPVVFASVHPPVPQIDTGLGQRGQLELVRILPPGKPAATMGRAYAVLPEPQVKVLDTRQPQPTPPPDSTLEQPKSVHWAAVFASVPRSAQQQAFLAADYTYDRSLLVVTSVEAERQRMLPGGEWAPPEAVRRTFSTVVLAGKRTVELTRLNGTPEIDPAEHQFISMFRQEAMTNQREILRPPLQAALPPEFQLEWTVPAAMPDGTKFDWGQDYGVGIPIEGETTPREGAAPPRFDYRKAKAEIDDLIAKSEFIKADQKVQDALREGPNLPVNQKKELDELALQLQPKVQQQALQIEQERTRRQAIEQATLGASTDLLWLNDLSVVPGETYRYRVRLLVFNPHAGLIRKLKNPEDAAKIVLAGDWSGWSDPVLLKPDRYLFCLGADGGQVKTELQQWAQGAWDKTNQTISLGQVLKFDDKLKEFTYGAVAAIIEPTASFEERSFDARRGIRYRDPRDTSSVILVRDDGQVEEHLVLADVTRRRELQSEFAPPNRETSIQRAMTPGQMPDYGRPGPGPGYPPRGYPGPGGRFRDGE